MRSVLLLLLVATACDVGEFGGGTVTIGAPNDELFRRVVLARMYQKSKWTLPQAGSTSAEHIAYVCGVLRQLRPSYVSGLIRLDDDTPLSQLQISEFVGVRDCLREGGRKVKFDVVLNAEHYTDNTRHASAAEALAALKARADEVRAKLGVTIIFFDFFSSPYNGSDKHAGWYTDALTDGTRYIRNTLDMRVTGNVWGLDAPPHADFIALDNFDRDSMPGFEYDKLQIEKLGGRYPLVLHIENNPQLAQSKGLQWINGTTEFRKDVLEKLASQQRLGYTWMYPVFFPLQCCAGATCGPDQCLPDTDRIAYDASRDGNMLQKMSDLLAEH